jgi:tricorn protease
MQNHPRLIIIFALLAVLFLSIPLCTAETAPPPGYFRFPAIFGNTIVFTAEGDLWKISAEGGIAQRLTSHEGVESNASISPKGDVIAFSAQYEGPTEVYTMPINGGLPTRRTFDGGWARVVGWTPDGHIIYCANRYSSLPDAQLFAIDTLTGISTPFPLSQASDAVYGGDGKTLYFVRTPFQGSYTKRYKGGTAQNIWRLPPGDSEAVSLTSDFPGTSKSPMWSGERIYFVSDRDGTMNLWSMNPEGGDLKQLTFHKGWDVKSPSVSAGRIVYQLGADLHVYTIAPADDRVVSIQLTSDFGQMREHWIKKPFDYLTSVHVSPNGDRVVLTARGQLFVAPIGPGGRLVEATHDAAIRYRQGTFMPDGKSLVALADKSGELEFWKIPANGIGQPEQMTDNAKTFRYAPVPSPDGKYIAYADKDNFLWIYDIAAKSHIQVASSPEGTPGELTWSPDSRNLAYMVTAENNFHPLMIYCLDDKTSFPITTDRYDSYSPSWTPDGKWIYFLSDRNLVSLVGGAWEPRQADPFLDRQAKIYMIPLVKGQRSPYQPDDELAKESKAEKNDAKADKKDAKEEKKDKADTAKTTITKIDRDGIVERIMDVPVPPGNYSNLSVTDDHLFWLTQETVPDPQKALVTMKIDNKKNDIDTLMRNVSSYEQTGDRKKLMVKKDNAIYVIAADGSSPSDLDSKRAKLDDWSFSLDPRVEWKQMFTEAWRLERDYFYDRHMHGVEWPAVLKKYLPLVDRITDRDELSDIFGEMIGELSALHMYVQGGDVRRGDDQIFPGSLGATLVRDESGGGYRVNHIYRADPDEPQIVSPLAKPGVDVHEGDIITSVNGEAALSAPGIGLLLRRQIGKQVLLEIKAEGSNAPRRVIVTPINDGQARNLRYSEWEYDRRMRVEKEGQGQIGYVHLRAMSGGDFSQWARDFYPVYLRQGLIVDVRHNNGGNIDSWILEKLIRKQWAYWQDRTGKPVVNMQYAFAGHMVVLCDEATASDGELFAEGFRRLGLGKVIGTRTWGGEIWLSFDTWLSDRGIATAAESGVFAPEGIWLIEGHGVDPDIVVQNLPHATFKGSDAQLEAAIKYLQEEIKAHPVERPKPPAYPDKSLKEKK